MSAAALGDVLFDLDGTLIDSAPAILASFRQAFAVAGVTPARAIDPAVIGPPLIETLHLLSGSDDQALIARLAGHFKDSYDNGGYRETSAYEGVEEMLRALAGRGLRLHIATNKRIKPTRLILEHLGWTPFFDAVYALDLFEPRLPDKAAMLGRLMGDRNLSVERSVYVGDREEDGLAATANALPFYAATWGYGSIDRGQLAPGWHHIETPAALVDALR